jgi:hypothetical protein
MVLLVLRLLVYVIHILSPFIIVYALPLGCLEVFFTLRLCFLSYLVQVET